MATKKMIKPLVVFAAMLAIVLTVVPLSSGFAEPNSPLHPKAPCKLKVDLPDNTDASFDVDLHLYQIATLSDEGTYQVNPAFSGLALAGSPIQGKEVLTTKSAEAADFRELAIAAQEDLASADLEPMSAKLKAGLKTPDRSNEVGQSNVDQVNFDGLQTGLYLLVADSVKQGEKTYEFNPVIVALPTVACVGFRGSVEIIDYSPQVTLKPTAHDDQPKNTITNYFMRNEDGNWVYQGNDLNNGSK